MNDQKLRQTIKDASFCVITAGMAADRTLTTENLETVTARLAAAQSRTTDALDEIDDRLGERCERCGERIPKGENEMCLPLCLSCWKQCGYNDHSQAETQNERMRAVQEGE